MRLDEMRKKVKRRGRRRRKEKERKARGSEEEGCEGKVREKTKI